MKKLTIKALKEMLNKNYLTRNYLEVLKIGCDFYVVYRDKVATYHFADKIGWCFSLNGSSLYGDTKALIKLIEVLDENYIGDVA